MSEESPDHSRKKKRKVIENFKAYQENYRLTNKWKGLMDAKLNNASPYYFFLTRIEESVNTHDEDLSITFPELLDESLGILEESLHINFMVELPWLLAQYAINDLINPQMIILYDCEDDDLKNVPPHLRVTAVKIKSISSFGHHHTKMSIFYYKDKSLRFAVYTANLIESDWENRTQGVWISPKCPFMGDEIPVNYGESESLFKVDVLQYINSYHLPELRDWLLRIKKADCSLVKVCFVASVPGDHKNSAFGFKKLSKIIKENCKNGDISSWELVAQCSSIGSLGPEPASWLCGQFAESLAEYPVPKSCGMSVIYPSVQNVRQSHDGMLGGACLPYSSATHNRQLWLSRYLKQWKSNHRHRSKAVPHIKSYTKLSPEGDKIAWFLLTSANLSKAAWGRFLKDQTLKILSYEAGVLFLPQLFINKNWFTVKKGGDSNANDENFPLPYDSPLTPYLSTDTIFLYDKCFSH